MFSKTYKLAVLFLLIGFSSFSQINDNKPFQITPYLGLSSPSSGLKDFAESGSVFGISVDKYISSKFALGIDLNFQSNSFSSPFDFSGITSPYSMTESANGKWNATAFTFGPTYKLGASKFNAELYTKFGLLYIKSPDARAIFNHSAGTKEIFNLPEQKRTGFGITSGIRLNYQVSKKLSLFLNPQYVYGSAKVEYCDCGVSGSSNPDDILEAESVKKTFSPSYLNVNAGLTFSLGGNPKTNRNTLKEVYELQEESICEETLLKEPYSGQTYFAESGIVPVFEWINYSKPKATSYDFELYYGDKLIFEKNVKTNSFKFTNKMVVDFYGIKDTRDYSWRVRTNYEDCETTITNYSSFTVQSRENVSRGKGECGYEFTNIDIQCDSPSYDDSGNVKFYGTFTVENGPDLGVLRPHTSAINGQDFDIDVPGTLTILSSTSSCPAVTMTTTPNGNAFSPNQQATYCFELEVPIGTSSVNFLSTVVTQMGTLDESLCKTSQLIKLPSCVCDLCQDWEYIDTEHTLNKFNVQSFPFNFQMAQSLQIIGADPIIEVKAEIIGIQHIANDPQCYTCTKHENKMGLFSFAPGFLQPRISGVSAQNDWLNGANATKGGDVNGDNYSNQAIWRAKDPSIGIDFNVMKRFILPISLPDPSSLDCCEHTFRVCVRYTFTTINCETCSYNQCYEYDGKSEPIDISNPSSGMGNTGSNIPNTNLNNN